MDWQSKFDLGENLSDEILEVAFSKLNLKSALLLADLNHRVILL